LFSNQADKKSRGVDFAVVETTQEDVPSNRKSRFRQTVSVESDGTWHPLDFPCEISDRCKMRITSPSGLLHACITVKGDAATCIEIFNHSQRLSFYDGSSMHGQIYTTGPFSGVVWSPSETSLAFVAERKAVSRPSFYDPPKPDMENGTEFEFQEDFGEEMEGMRLPTVFVLSLPTNISKDITSRTLPENYFPGQPTWVPGSDEELLVTAWETHHGRRLGMVFYNTRFSSIVWLRPAPSVTASAEKDDLPSTWLSLDPASSHRYRTLTTTAVDQSAQEPRFSGDGKTLVFVSTPVTSLHASSWMVRTLAWPPSNDPVLPTIRTVVDCVSDPGSSDTDFPGIFRILAVPRRVWLSDHRHFLLSTHWRSSTALVNSCFLSSKLFSKIMRAGDN
jgi:hypothetical protein